MGRKSRLSTDEEGELERRGKRCEKEADQKSVWMRLLTQLDTSSALPRCETEKFSRQQKNKYGILAPRCRAPNFVQMTILMGREIKTYVLAAII